MANPNPKRPKRKKRSALSRNTRSGRQRNSSYNYSVARQELGLPDDANAPQITSKLLVSGPNLQAPKGKSPSKREIKAQLAEKDATISKLELGADRMERKVSAMEKTIRDLSRALMDEKKKSRLAMEKLVDDTEAMIAESLDNRDQLDSKMSAAELAIQKERERVIDERKYSSIVVSSREFIYLHYYICFYESILIILSTFTFSKTEA